MMANYCIYMPNYLRDTNAHLHATGTCCVVHDKKLGINPTIDTGEGKPLYVFDPRCVIVDQETHTVEYSPRMVPLKEHAKWVRDWIREHAAWGVPGCEKDLLAATQACTQH